MTTRSSSSTAGGGAGVVTRVAFGGAGTGRAASQGGAPKGADVHGQALPFSQAEFDAALGAALGRKRGYNREHWRGDLNLGGQDYFVKPAMEREYEKNWLGSETPVGQSVAHEAFAAALAREIGLGENVPRESYDLVSPEGRHYSVQSREPGTMVGDLSPDERHQFDRAAAADMRHELLGFVLGARDRWNEGNVLYDAARDRIIHIDFAQEFGSGRSYVRGLPSPMRKAITDNGRQTPDSVLIPHEALRPFVEHTEQIMKTAERYGLEGHVRSGLSARLAILARLDRMRAPTLAQLDRYGESQSEQQAWRQARQQQIVRPG